jgi:hypothetical protein
MRRFWPAVGAACITSLALLGVASAHPEQHGGTDGHLSGSSANVTLVGKGFVQDAKEGIIADVGVYGNYAYLGKFYGDFAACRGPEGDQEPDGGIYVMDISNPAAPKQVGFIPGHQDTYTGEGVQVEHIETKYFQGEILTQNNESCGRIARNVNRDFELNNKGGLSLWDVTNALRPVKLVDNVGDYTSPELNSPRDANDIHSVFIWQDDKGTATRNDNRAYAVMTDNEEAADVDILDITDPRKPVLIAEYDLNTYGVAQPELGLTESFLHDMVVKKIGGNFIMLLSYWDGGYIKLNVNDPAKAVFLGDTDYAAVDPELFESTGLVNTPEGNGHQAEFTKDSNWFIATDEDFDPYRVTPTIHGGYADGQSFFSGQGDDSPQVPPASLAGDIVFFGRGCNGDANPGAAPAGAAIAVVERGLCTFQEKALNVQALGYDGAIVFNNDSTADNQRCEVLLNMDVDPSITIPMLFVARSTGFKLMNQPYDGVCPGGTSPLPALGPIAGQSVSVQTAFDGWGYVHLFDANSLAHRDTFAIPEAHDPAFATGFGDLSVHEVATDPDDNRLAYLSYYSGGFRVLKIVGNGGGARLEEVGHYIDHHGNNFWGVQVHKHPNGQKYVLASDRDSGLWIFQYTP